MVLVYMYQIILVEPAGKAYYWLGRKRLGKRQAGESQGARLATQAWGRRGGPCQRSKHHAPHSGSETPHLIVRPLITLHDELMSSGDEHQAVRVVELLRDVLKKKTQDCGAKKQRHAGGAQAEARRNKTI